MVFNHHLTCKKLWKVAKHEKSRHYDIPVYLQKTPIVQN